MLILAVLEVINLSNAMPNSYAPGLSEDNFLYFVAPFLGVSLGSFLSGGVLILVEKRKLARQLLSNQDHFKE